MPLDAPDARATAFAAASVPENYERRLAPIIFEPWAEILVDVVGVASGSDVLDIASGTGVVSRLAARRAGPAGRVVASDISGPMLAHAAVRPAQDGSAPVDYVEASAIDLPFDDGSFDIALCQQGLQFFPDRSAAVREIGRVLRPGGVAGVSVWASGHRLEPFDDYAEALCAAGAVAPFPGAFENASFVMTADEARRLFESSGFTQIDISVVEHTVSWPDAQSAAAGIAGTPFGPTAAGLAADQREQLDAELRRRFESDSAGAPVRRQTVAVVGRAVAGGT